MEDSEALNQSFAIADQKLLVMNQHDQNYIVNFFDMTVDVLPDQGIKRFGFGIHYQEKENLLWTVGGSPNPTGIKVVK